MTIIKVGIADLQTVRAPDRIKTSGLGSCVGVILYDLTKQAAGLAHVMLPDSKLAKQSQKNVLKFADTAVDSLMDEVCSIGARKYALKAKMAGGAQMFDSASNQDSIGDKNVQAVQAALLRHHITPEAMDVGGHSGRTIEFNPADGMLSIRTVYKGETII
ncbi:chemoreceptor glutamine deamidase CheD [Barrientosiimonas marina]|uniref:Probable chemoreceptor glutamine deamidase CheD n=1 Tax=Lentibacillus kimchii TaxID=1542911 RepID=A0ABW2US28_9BACI